MSTSAVTTRFRGPSDFTPDEMTTHRCVWRTPHFSAKRPFTSDGLRVAFASSHPNHRVERGDPDLAVADLAGVCGADDRCHDGVRGLVLDQHLHPRFGDEVHCILG